MLVYYLTRGEGKSHVEGFSRRNERPWIKLHRCSLVRMRTCEEVYCVIKSLLEMPVRFFWLSWAQKWWRIHSQACTAIVSFPSESEKRTKVWFCQPSWQGYLANIYGFSCSKRQHSTESLYGDQTYVSFNWSIARSFPLLVLSTAVRIKLIMIIIKPLFTGDHWNLTAHF